MASSFAFFRTISFRTNSEMFTTTPARIPPRMTRPQLMDFMRLLLSEAADIRRNCRESAWQEHRPGRSVSQEGGAAPGHESDWGALTQSLQAKSQGTPESLDTGKLAPPRGRYLAVLC